MKAHYEHPAPDQALAERPRDYTDPELAAYTDEMAHDILEDVISHMPIVLGLSAALQIFLLAFIAVTLA